MFFRLINASTIYQILINNISVRYLDIYAVTYLDNILIYSKNLKNHWRYVKDILEWLLIRQLRYKSEKYEFHRKKVDFLGFIMGINKIKINSEKIRKVLDWSELRNLKKLQRFLGFGNFNRRFISKYLFIILLLIELIKKDILFIWIIFYQKIFNKLKRVFIIVSYLILFISDRSVRIETNISDKDLGTCLLQQDEDKI